MPASAMDGPTLGIILRTRPLTETSLIVHWLTPDAGRIATVAKGARRPQSPFRGKLDLFYLAALSYRLSRRSELHTLCEVVLKDTSVTAEDVEGGSKITVKPNKAVDLEWLKKETAARKAANSKK